MSNDITVNPIVIDTAAAGTITTNTFKIYKIRWVSTSSTAGDNAEVQNAAGTVKWEGLSDTATNYVDESTFDPPLIMAGLIVPTLDDGTLYIYVKKVPL